MTVLDNRFDFHSQNHWANPEEMNRAEFFLSTAVLCTIIAVMIVGIKFTGVSKFSIFGKDVEEFYKESLV